MLHFVGLPLQTLLTAGAIAGGLVVVLYILKLKRRPVAVPFSRLWERILRDKEATSLFSQLKRLLSLLLQLALLALLLLALGDPRTAQNLLEGRNVVILVDSSASMQATDVSPSRLAEGKRKIRDSIRGLGGSDRMLVAQMDGAITPLSTMTNDVTELEAALDAIKPSETRADFPRALRFATDTLRGLPNAEIIVVSDGALGPAADQLGAVDLADTKLSFVGVGTGSRNAAVTGFSVRRYPLDKSRYEVMLEVTNTGSEDLDLDLVLCGDGSLTDVSRLKLKAGERLPRFYPNLSGASRTLEARLAGVKPDGEPTEDPCKPGAVLGADDLPADDVGYALLPERRRSRIQVVTNGNMYLEAALLLDEYLDVTTVSPKRYPADGVFDVTIFDGVAPAVATGSGHVFYLDPKGNDLPFAVDKELLNDKEDSLGFDEIEADHPIVRYTELSETRVYRAHSLKPGKEDKVIAKSFQGPILIAGRRSGYKFVALGLDLRETDLPLRISWPMLLLNIINDFVEEDTSYISSFTTGNVWRIPAPSQLEVAKLIDPSGVERTVPVQEGRAVFLGQRAGVYTLRSDEGGEKYETMFAANLVDSTESRIEPQKTLKIGDTEAGEVTGFTVGVRRELWAYLLFAVIAISLVEWLTYHRRVTV